MSLASKVVSQIVKLDEVLHPSSLTENSFKIWQKDLSDLVKNENAGEFKLLSNTFVDSLQLIDNVATFKNSNLKPVEVLEKLRRGDVETISEMYTANNSSAQLSETAKNGLSKMFISNFPDAEIFKISKIKESLLASEPNLFTKYSFDLNVKVDVDKVESILKRARQQHGAKEIVQTLFYGAVPIATVAGFIAYYNSVKNTSAGYFRIYKDGGGKFVACKIKDGSCVNPEIGAGGECLERPSVLNSSTCAGYSSTTDDSPCRKWDIHADSQKERYLDPKKVFHVSDRYQCRDVPSVGEVLASTLKSVGETVEEGVSYVFEETFNILKWALLGGSVLVVTFLIFKAYDTSKHNKHHYDDEDNDDDEEDYNKEEYKFKNDSMARPVNSSILNNLYDRRNIVRYQRIV